MYLVFGTLPLPASLAPLFSLWGEQFGKLERTLYSACCSGDPRPLKHKTEFCREYEVLAREFNGFANSLGGRLSGITEQLKSRKKDTQSKLTSAKHKLTKARDRLASAVATLKKTKPVMLAKARQAVGRAKTNLDYWERQVPKLEANLTEIKAELAKPVPALCFGSRTLFNQQFKEDTDHEAWLTEWQGRRSNQFYLVGSHDETAGNQLCQATLPINPAPNCQTLVLDVKLRVPDWLQAQTGITEKHVFFRAEVPSGQVELHRILTEGKAVSYRFIRDSQNRWSIKISVEVLAPLLSMSARQGMVGIDFNENHLAVTETDFSGNPVAWFNVPFNLVSKTGDQREQILSDALYVVVKHALAVKKGIVIEDLDFTARKKRIREIMSRLRRVGLSSFCYSQYEELLESKCARRGVLFMKINPAYTSVKGQVKYACAKGMTVHQGAALVIARTGQGFCEKPSKAGSVVRIPLAGGVVDFVIPARNERDSADTAWKVIKRSLNKVVVELHKSRKVKPSPAGKPRTEAGAGNSGCDQDSAVQYLPEEEIGTAGVACS